MEPQVGPIVFTKQPDLKLSDPAYLRALTGAYDSGGTKVVIALLGNRLIYTAEGGSPADLIPSLGGEFVHSRALDSRIAFKTDASGRVSAMTMTDSAGVFEAKRID